ncbi:MAG: hypothetical protein M0Q88_03005 [Bacilli bacterium]|nr:hypothetical protein [Bacilli bacterium]
MRFEIWICLDLEKDLKEQEQTILGLIMAEIEYMTQVLDEAYVIHVQ